MVVSGEASLEKHQPPCSAQASQNLDPCIMEDTLSRTLSDSCWAAFDCTMLLVGRFMEDGRGGGPREVTHGYTQVFPPLVV